MHKIYYRFSNDTNDWKKLSNKTNLGDKRASYEMMRIVDEDTTFVKIENLETDKTYDIWIETHLQNYEASSITIHGKFALVENAYKRNIFPILIYSYFPILKLKNMSK